jgi:hypothetical protein
MIHWGLCWGRTDKKVVEYTFLHHAVVRIMQEISMLRWWREWIERRWLQL